MVTFGEIYQEVCEADYGLRYADMRDYLHGEYVSQWQHPKRLEIIWTASNLAVPRLLRGEIFDHSIVSFAQIAERDLQPKRNLALVGNTAVASRIHCSQEILDMLTAGPQGLILYPSGLNAISQRAVETIG